MSGTVALEAQLNGSVKEFLDYYGFSKTLDTFTEECALKGKSIADLDKKANSNQKINVLMNEMVNLFLQGQRKDFFRRWVENISDDQINWDLSAQKLELELNIHFAIYSFRKSGKDPRASPRESMNAFKEYIENKGRFLCQTKEFLPYFGLPYHQNPQDGFPELFSEAWIADLENKLEDFLKKTLKYQNQPKLVEIFTQQTDSDTNSQFVKMKQQLIESERRTMAFMRKFNRVQSDYHGLIGITAELVDSLENTINGKPVSNEYIQNICFKLFNTQLKQTIDFTRPGTAGHHIRKSLAYQKIASEKSEIKLPLLDFVKIKHDLVYNNERRQITLLQALRWCLTQTDSTELRQKILTSFITADLLNFRVDKKQKSVADLLKSPNETIKEFMARLINTFASLNFGRSYLASNHDFVKNMIIHLQNEKDDSFTRKHLLAALQKLSLRHDLHAVMINENTIEYLVDLLEDNESLSDYSLEYAIALLMNLVLKKKGKNKCISDHKRILKLLSELLGKSSTEIQNCVNGTLFSILSVPEIRSHAREINLANILKNYLTQEDEYVNKQRDVLIHKINSDELVDNENDDEEDEDDEEDGDAMEQELDGGEIIFNQADEAIGKPLLLSFYSIGNQGNEPHQELTPKQKLENEFLTESNVLNRPITPFNMRQSLVIQKQTTSQTLKLNQSQTIGNKLKSSTLTNKKEPSANLKSSLSFNNRAPSHERQSNKNSQSRVLNDSLKISDKNKPTTNILVINSNDLKVIDSYEPTPVKYASVNESNEAFFNKPKIQRTPDQSMSLRQKSSAQSINLQSPKFSITEPRPSSANSSKSKNSSTSSNQNQN